MASQPDDELGEEVATEEDGREQFVRSMAAAQLKRRTNEGRGRLRLRLTRFKVSVTIVLLALTISAYSTSLPISSVLTDPDEFECIPPKTHSEADGGQGRVALIDQLALQYPNPGFADGVALRSTVAGRAFDYFPPEAATLDFFLNLPASDHSIVILRTHGTGINLGEKASITTSDPYSKYRRVGDQLLERLIPVDINGETYFGLTPTFISEVMCGRFPGTLVLSMWCGGGGWMEVARAFVEKGAGGFIGWNGRVTVGHTDLTFQLLVELLLNGYAPDMAVRNVMERIGPDPWTGARLVYHT